MTIYELNPMGKSGILLNKDRIGAVCEIHGVFSLYIRKEKMYIAANIPQKTNYGHQK